MRRNPIVFSFLKELPLFQGLTENELFFVMDNMEEKEFNPKENVFEEFDKSNFVCLLYKGKIEVLKWDKEKERQFQITTLHIGEMFGEMGFIDEQERSATVKSINKATVFILKNEAFDPSNPKQKSIYNQLIANISKIDVPRLRSTNEGFVKSMQSQMKQLQIQNQFGHFFICVLIVFGIGNIFDSLAAEKLVDVRGRLYNWSYLVTLLIPFLVIIRVFRFSLSEAGVTFKNWKKSLLDGVVISLILIIAYNLGLKELLIWISKEVGSRKPIVLFNLVNLVYLPDSYVQEFIARGIFQTVLQKFYGDVKGTKSILVTSLVFSLFHIHIGFATAVGVFLFSLLFGFIYVRSYNLIGVSLVHFVTGMIAGLIGAL